MGQPRAALRIARLDLRRRIGNRSFVIQTIVGPIVLASIISLAFGSAWSVEATIGVVDADGSEAVTAFVDGVVASSAEGLRFEPLTGVDLAREQVDRGDLDAAILVPEGFAASLTRADPLPLEVVTSPSDPIAGEVAGAVADGFVARIDAARLAATAWVARGSGLPDEAELAAIELPVDVAGTSPGDESFPGAFFGPAMGLLFLFLAVAVLARDLLAEQRLGLLDRVRAAPVHDATILAGKAMSVVVIGVVTLGVVWGATSVTLGADWGDPLGVALVIVAVSLTVAALSGFVAAVARTEQSADMLASFLAFSFGLIGGNFVGPGSLPDAVRRLSLLTPNGWAMDAFNELSAGSATAADVLLHAGVLTAMAAAIGGAATVLLPHRIGARR